jgi:hypothetical protein
MIQDYIMVVGLFCNLSPESERRLYSVSFPLVIKRLLDTVRELDRSTLHALICLLAMAVVVWGGFCSSTVALARMFNQCGDIARGSDHGRYS